MERKRSSGAKKTTSRQQVDPASVPSNPAVETEDPYLAAEQEEIGRLAYSYWEARGGQGGSPEEDWRRAEEEVRARRASGL